MSKKDQGGHFHPPMQGPAGDLWEGVTRRDWLAGLAMQALFTDKMLEELGNKYRDHPEKIVPEITRMAHEMADAMIKEGEK